MAQTVAPWKLDRKEFELFNFSPAFSDSLLGYSLQSNRKTLEGSSHPDRDAQFEHIYAQVKLFQGSGDPVISVDTKKKEQVGNFKQGGQEWQPSVPGMG